MGEIILITRALRLEWIDAMALDENLSDRAFRVAAVIGRHFNRASGEAFLATQTIARALGVSERTAWSGLHELELRGYLIVSRRELTPRNPRSDGKRFYGGKGVANVYRPAFESSQILATKRNTKLAEFCEQRMSQSSQNRVPKLAKSCEPTLSSPSVKNPAAQISTWPKFEAEMRTAIGDARFRAFFQNSALELGPPVRITVERKALVGIDIHRNAIKRVIGEEFEVRSENAQRTA